MDSTPDRSSGHHVGLRRHAFGRNQDRHRQIARRFEGRRHFVQGNSLCAPPVGDLRWRPPQAVKPWTDVRPATAYGPDCMQQPFPGDAAPLGVPPAEDCLYVNVWAPDGSAGKKLPVMVWIYGGGFVNGGSSPSVYDGTQFAKRGIVFVSFNYRVGRFGFFALSRRSPKRTRRTQGQLRLHGPDRGAPVGAQEYRGLRRRPGERDHLRRIGRRRLGPHADDFADVEGVVPARHHRVGRRPHAADGAALPGSSGPGRYALGRVGGRGVRQEQGNRRRRRRCAGRAPQAVRRRCHVRSQYGGAWAAERMPARWSMARS